MKKIISSIGISTFLLVGCGGDNNSTEGTGGDQGGGSDQNGPNQKPYLTASLSTGSIQAPEWAYFNFDQGEVVNENQPWHIAFKRMEVKVNQNVLTAVGKQNETFYDEAGSPIVEAFVNVDTDQQEQQFFNLQGVAEDQFQAVGLSTVIDSSWYSYNPQTHQMSAMPEHNWIIRNSSRDAYAKFRAVEINNYVVQFEFYVQKDNADVFAEDADTVAIDLTETKQTCFSLISGEVDCSDNDWDVQFDIKSRAYQIKLNNNVSAYGSEEFAEFTSGTEEGLAFAYEQDQISSAFTETSPWAYGVNGGHYVWPNYTTYVIKLADDAEPIKIQLLSYYGKDEDISGTIYFRYMDLSDSGEMN